MDPTLEFVIDSLNMEFTIELAADGHSIPNLLFVDILTEKIPINTSLHMLIQRLFDFGCKHRT